MLQSADTTTFEYDYTGKRTKKNNVVYAYAGDKLIYEKSPNHTIYYFYDAKGISGFRYNNANYQYVKNALGDVVGIVHNGQLVAHYTYDAWGTCTILKDSAIAQLNPIRYRGYYYDTETGLYYCLTRYYNPAYGSFISPDTVDYLDPESINGLNLYCYCMNNPIMYADPSGHLPQWAMWLIGGVVIAGLAIATIATGGAAGGVAGFVLAGALKGAVVGAVSGALLNGTISGISSAIDGEGFWSGFAEGAAHGFMSGAVIGGITGAISSGVQVYNASKLWANTGNKTAYKQMVEHYENHVIREGKKLVAKNIVNYSKQASQFFANNSSSGFALRQGVIKIAGAPGGIFNADGLIRSFWYVLL